MATDLDRPIGDGEAKSGPPSADAKRADFDLYPSARTCFAPEHTLVADAAREPVRVEAL